MIRLLRYIGWTIVWLVVFYGVVYATGIIVDNTTVECQLKSGADIKVIWKKIISDFYHVRVMRTDNSTQYAIKSTVLQEATFTIPSGHFEIEVRKCSDSQFTDSSQVLNVDGGICYCGDWLQASDEGNKMVLMSGNLTVYGAWRIWARLGPPGAPTIN